MRFAAGRTGAKSEERGRDPVRLASLSYRARSSGGAREESDSGMTCFGPGA